MQRIPMVQIKIIPSNEAISIHGVAVWTYSRMFMPVYVDTLLSSMLQISYILKKEGKSKESSISKGYSTLNSTPSMSAISKGARSGTNSAKFQRGSPGSTKTSSLLLF